MARRASSGRFGRGERDDPLGAILRGVREADYPVYTAAHRGDSQNAPESTLAAFRRALDIGVEFVEFDVRLTGDDAVVVIHDDRLDRTTDGKGSLREMPLAEVQRFDAGSWFHEDFAGEHVPSLDEVLDLVRGRAVPLIDIKDSLAREPEIGPRIVETVRRHGMAEQVLVLPRGVERVAQIHALAPELPLAYLTFTKRRCLQVRNEPGVRGFALYWKSLSLTFLERCVGERRFVLPWTVNKRSNMEKLLLLGCRGIITDCPVLLRDLVESFEFERTREFLEHLKSAGKDGHMAELMEEEEEVDDDIDQEVDVLEEEEEP